MINDSDVKKIIRELSKVVEKEMMNFNDEVLTLDGVCALLKKSKRSVYNAIYKNEIPFHTVNGRRVFSKNEILKAVFQR